MLREKRGLDGEYQSENRRHGHKDQGDGGDDSHHGFPAERDRPVVANAGHLGGLRVDLVENTVENLPDALFELSGRLRPCRHDLALEIVEDLSTVVGIERQRRVRRLGLLRLRTLPQPPHDPRITDHTVVGSHAHCIRGHIASNASVFADVERGAGTRRGTPKGFAAESEVVVIQRTDPRSP